MDGFVSLEILLEKSCMLSFVFCRIHVGPPNWDKYSEILAVSKEMFWSSNRENSEKLLGYKGVSSGEAKLA
ncbi:hypothetical protein Tco_0754618 [Tanacetum coccineum]